MKRSFCFSGFLPALLLLGGLSATPGQAQQTRFSHVYAFGDSYLDNGALRAVSEEAVRAKVPGAMILPRESPAGVYWQGRWSNGPTSVEVLAKRLNVGLSDYAVGGARCGSGNYDTWLDGWRDTGLRGQILAFLSGGQALDRDALYVMGASANDFFQKIDFSKPISLPEMAWQCATEMQDAVNLLARHGARHFLVLSAYGLDRVPAVASNVKTVALAQEFQVLFDRDVHEALDAPHSSYGITLRWFSVAMATENLIRDREKYHITDTVNPCQVTFPQPQKACADPDQHLWWDEYHPTRRAHAIVADKILEGLEER